MVAEGKWAFSPAEVAELTGLSLNHVYMLIRTGKIISVKLGRRVLVNRHELERVLSPGAKALTDAEAGACPAK